MESINIFNQAQELHQQNKLHDAIDLYLRILQEQHENPFFLYLVGTAYCGVGEFDLSIDFLQHAIRLDSKNYAAHNSLGIALKELKRIDEAIASYDEAIYLKHDYVEAYYNRGVALAIAKRFIEALASYNKAITLRPDYSDAYNNLGNVMRNLGRFDEALASYETAIKLKPNYAEAYFNRGIAFNDLNLFDHALASYEKAITIKPDFAEAYNNQGATLRELSRYDESLASFDKATYLKPDYAEAHLNRCNVLMQLKRFSEALETYEKLLFLCPQHDYLLGDAVYTRMQLCKWDSFDSDLNLLKLKTMQLEKISAPFPLLVIIDDPLIQKISSRIYVSDKYPKCNNAPTFITSRKKSKIKIGYFSADFHGHATMHLMAELFEKHDKDQFETFGFSFGPITNDDWETRSRNAFQKFINCQNHSDIEIAQLSRDFGINIAIDLKGFTAGARPEIFAKRPAPIQVNFLGYPGTMGADYMDYLIADNTLVPEEYQCFYSEKIAYMPNCYQPNCLDMNISLEKVSRSQFGLPEQGIVFSSFNDNYKITPSTFASWAHILREVSNSVLWLLASNPTAIKNLKVKMSAMGIDPDRLVFAEKLPIPQHLNRMKLADIMLDTFPCGAHTTCSDALRVGLPVITLMGKSFASRVASSLLKNFGFSNLIAESQSSYEEMAINLAKNPINLSEIRTRLKDRIKLSPLFDSDLFTRNLESLYGMMHQKWCDGMPPDHIRLDRS